MLKNRIISSSILISVISAALYADWHRMFSISLAGILVVILIIAGLYEFFKMMEKKGISNYKYFGIAMGAILPLSILFRFELTKRWELLFIVVALLGLILMQFRRRNNSGVVIDISTTLFGILYVSWFFSFLIKIAYLPAGVGLLITVVLITKLGDIGAFLIGSRFGKTPLIPRISPKKSVEGAAGGLIFSVLAALICQPLLSLSYLHVAAIGLALGILGQLGDLSESLIKRDCQVKDSGSIFPGLGGVLDSIDSILFTAPAFYFYLSAVLK